MSLGGYMADYARESEVVYRDETQTVTLSVVGNRLFGRLWAVSPGKPFLVVLSKRQDISAFLRARLDLHIEQYRQGKHPFQP